MAEKKKSKVLITNPTNDDMLIDTERIVIVCLLSNTTLLPDAVAELDVDDFLSREYRIVYQAIYTLYQESKIINFDTVHDFIVNHSELIGNLPNFEKFYNQLKFDYTSDANFKFAIDYVKVASIKRKLNVLCSKITAEAIDVNNFTQETTDWLSQFSNIIFSKKTEKMLEIKEIANKYMSEKLGQWKPEDKHELTGTDSGYKCINAYFDGFQPGDLIILAARPGTGKTALALNFAVNAAKSLRNDPNYALSVKRPIVVIFSMEMGKEQLLERMIASESYVDISKIKKNYLNPHERDMVRNATEQLAELPILINDSSALSIMDIQANLHRYATDYDIKLVIVDYLQLLKGSTGNFSNSNRQQEVANISRLLKHAAREINTPVIALAQLSRKIEERRSKTADGDNPKPLLSDLRESGAIEQDADIVTFLYYKNAGVDADNEEENKENEKPQMKAERLVNAPIEFLIEKHRNGATGSCSLNFFKQVGRFVEFSSEKKQG